MISPQIAGSITSGERRPASHGQISCPPRLAGQSDFTALTISWARVRRKRSAAGHDVLARKANRIRPQWTIAPAVSSLASHELRETLEATKAAELGVLLVGDPDQPQQFVIDVVHAAQ